MLLTRDEMTFDFRGARFRPDADRELLAFIFSQFLYGEVTGIQVGHWLRLAPDLEAATFLARQATEEMAHVRSFLEIFRQLGERPAPPHRLVRFLATGFMGGTYPEHTCLEMALGEGFVLMVFYALIDTLDHSGMVRVLEAAAPQEERHVRFGEEQTAKLVASDPGLKEHLLGLSLVSLRTIEKLAPQTQRIAPDHPVMKQMPEFLGATVRAAELRLQRMGVLDGPLDELGGFSAKWRITSAMIRRYGRGLLPRRRRYLTDTYLQDPLLDRFAALEREE
jgi:hypothetical protein